jgi:hypothetical protein
VILILKKLLLVALCMMLIIPIAFALKECQRVQTVSDIPCIVISSWNPGTCSNYNVTIYNANGVIIQNATWQTYLPVCSFNFTITTLGTYNYNSSIENGVITVQEDSNMQIGLVIAIGLIITLFMWLAYKLEESHGLLKLLLIFVSIGLITLLPSVFLSDNPAIIFNKAIMIFTWIFWIYVAVYFIWWLFERFSSYVPR